SRASCRLVTPDYLEELALAYDRVRDLVARHSISPKNPLMWDDRDRLHEFSRHIGDRDAARQADIYWRISTAPLPQQSILVRFSPWLVTGRAELTSTLLSEVARQL